LQEKYERFLQAFRWKVEEVSPPECHSRCRAVGRGS
jgi:hypothetical protein